MSRHYLLHSEDKEHAVEITHDREAYLVKIDDVLHRVELLRQDGPKLTLLLEDGRVFKAQVVFQKEKAQVLIEQTPHTMEFFNPYQAMRSSGVTQSSQGLIQAPMPGKVIEVKAKPGDTVEAGQALLIVEAMKMQNEIYAPITGVIQELHVEVGITVEAGQKLILVIAEESIS